METIWIIGAGKFGQLAAKRLQHKFKILIIDSNTDLHADVHQDGVTFLVQHLNPDSDVAWIIPCLPLHLAWEWCRLKVGSNKTEPGTLIPQRLPPEIDTLLPNPMRGKNTDIYVSHADFLCPDNCSEPDIICTKTKQPRKQDMHAFLESFKFKEYHSLVLKSHQIGPGIGGYRPKALFFFLNQIRIQKKSVLISTACRCHAVITGAKIISPE